MREYGTLGRMPKDQPPPYQDFLGGPNGGEQILIRWVFSQKFKIGRNFFVHSVLILEQKFTVL